MKRFFILATLALVAFLLPTMNFAQDRASENAQISARVISSLSIAKNQDLDFGKVAQGVGTVAIAPGTTKAVKFTITGEPGESIKVTFTSPAQLMSGSNQLPFSSNVKASTADASATAPTLASGSSLALGTDGKGYVYLGGSITVAAAQARGNYSGTFSIQVEY